MYTHTCTYKYVLHHQNSYIARYIWNRFRFLVCFFNYFLFVFCGVFSYRFCWEISYKGTRVMPNKIQSTVRRPGNSSQSFSSCNQALLKHNVHVVALKSNRCFFFFRAHIAACHMHFWCVRVWVRVCYVYMCELIFDFHLKQYYYVASL